MLYEGNELGNIVRNYILSILSAGIICGIVCSLVSKQTTVGQIAKMLCGILMAVTVLSPIKNISFRDVTRIFEDYSAQAQAFVQEGKEAAEQSISDIILSQTEAYILDKANRMGLQIAVEVELDAQNNSVPSVVTITGDISPYAREIMGAYIEDNLGITKENQRWS